MYVCRLFGPLPRGFCLAFLISSLSWVCECLGVHGSMDFLGQGVCCTLCLAFHLGAALSGRCISPVWLGALVARLVSHSM
jgi:hypothetical protein